MHISDTRATRSEPQNLFAERAQNVEFRPFFVNPNYTGIASTLVSYAEGRLVCPVDSSPIKGVSRSANFTEPSTQLPLTGKGIMLITGSADGKVIAQPPCFITEVTQLDRLHLSLNVDFTVATVTSAPKSAGSLTRKGALAESTIGNKLFPKGRALEPILGGEFILRSTGQPEIDSAGNATGGFFRRRENALICLEKLLSDIVIPTPNGDMILRRNKEVAPANRQHLSAFLQSLTPYYHEIGAARADALFDVGVLRHSATLGNIYWHPEILRVILTDFDSCLLRDNLELPLVFPHMVRDIASDIIHLLRRVSSQALCPQLLDALSDSESPLTSYFQGLLGNKDIIKHRSAIALINSRFHHFLETHIQLLCQARNQLLASHFRPQDKDASLIQKTLQHAFNTLHDALWAPALVCAYSILKHHDPALVHRESSSLPDTDNFMKRILPGLADYIQLTHNESMVHRQRLKKTE